jgi:hypothetical protein
MAAASRLGDAIGQAACVGVEFIGDAREVLTTEQMNLLERHIENYLDQHLDHVRIMPAKVHELIDFFGELNLTPGQKGQVLKLIAEKHATHRARHHGMKRIF